MRSQLWPWLQDQCRRIFEKCREESSLHLADKFNRLITDKRGNQDGRTHRTGRSNEAGHVHQVRPSLQHPVSHEEVSPPESEVTANEQADRGSTASTASFKNLSDIQLEANLSDLLSRGPKFALTRKVTEHVLKEVESGMERGAYALRWKVDIESRRAAQQQQQQHQQQQQ